jgi:putative transcriptional regulator
MPNHFHSNSSGIHYARINQAMRTRLLILLFLDTLLFSGWPAMLHADPLEQIPHASDSPAFLLVASQQMADPRFRKTVLLVTRHGNTGPIGVIVNRSENITLDKILPEYPAAKEFSLFNGGPLYPGQISYLVRGGDAVERTLTISSNIYLAYDMPILGELLGGKRRYKNLRVMHGMASWAPGQLEHEIKLGDWVAMPIDDAVIFDLPPADMWRELHRRTNHLQEI